MQVAGPPAVSDAEVSGGACVCHELLHNAAAALWGPRRPPITALS